MSEMRMPAHNEKKHIAAIALDKYHIEAKEKSAMSYNHNYYQETIQKMLYELIRDKDITVLMVVLIGSRAYGCAGPNSDYDIRFIYKQQEDHISM